MCNSVTSVLCGPAPCQENTQNGIFLSVIKRVALGLILTAGLSAGFYFGQMALGNAWNPYHWSLATLEGGAIAAAVLAGITGLSLTAISIYKAIPAQRKDTNTWLY